MPNHNHLIAHADVTRYTRPALAAKAVISKLDTDLRALDRRADLYDHERTQRKADARRDAEAELRKLRAEMAEHLAEHRSWSTTHTDSPPSGEDAQRRAYYSTRAQAELAHLTEADALALVQRMAATGDLERGQEYVAAARGRVPAGALRALERQVESVDTAGARYWGAAVDAIDTQLGWFDRHVANLMDQAGNVTAEVERDPQTGAPLPWPGDRAPEAPINTRVLDLWASGLSGHAGNAFAASKESDGQWSDVAASLATGGLAGGWDAGDQGDQQSQGDPLAPAGAPTDATADRSDAQADA